MIAVEPTDWLLNLWHLKNVSSSHRHIRYGPTLVRFSTLLFLVCYAQLAPNNVHKCFGAMPHTSKQGRFTSISATASHLAVKYGIRNIPYSPRCTLRRETSKENLTYVWVDWNHRPDTAILPSYSTHSMEIPLAHHRIPIVASLMATRQDVWGVAQAGG
jgi:hypothetical protein